MVIMMTWLLLITYNIIILNEIISPPATNSIANYDWSAEWEGLLGIIFARTKIIFYIITTCLGAFLSVFTYILDRSDLGVKAVAADSEADGFNNNSWKCWEGSRDSKIIAKSTPFECSTVAWWIANLMSRSQFQVHRSLTTSKELVVMQTCPLHFPLLPLVFHSFVVIWNSRLHFCFLILKVRMNN